MKRVLIILLGLSLVGHAVANESLDDPAEVSIGERLFLETRFAQAYYAKPGKADPVMDKTVMATTSLKGPFAGQTMNCRACHLVDEFAEHSDGGLRTYADYAMQSPIPSRNDGNDMTGRNSMSLVNIAVPMKDGHVFHFDGEFNTMEDLVMGTLTGRNYGWKTTEYNVAIKHIANIIRNDDGKGKLANEFGGSYAKIFEGSDKSIPLKFRLPNEYRVDVSKANDVQIVTAATKLIAVYVTGLTFSQDEAGVYNGSPYDAFLKRNNLPRQPSTDESFASYSQRLLLAVNKLERPDFVTGKKESFKTHKQQFIFGEKELNGMKLFFTKGNKVQSGGNCISCHSAPHFSDYKFHNTGLTQHNYDKTHGKHAFNKLNIPNIEKRNGDYDAYLPSTVKHPHASSRFRHSVKTDKPGFVDLGLWNVFANPDMPVPQKKLKNMLCEQVREEGSNNCQDDDLLRQSIASFKTPVLRDLGHTAPYMHTGQFNELKNVVDFYISSSAMSRNNKVRNGDKKLNNIYISPKDSASLVAFIRSLNEDYD